MPIFLFRSLSVVEVNVLENPGVSFLTNFQ